MNGLPTATALHRFFCSHYSQCTKTVHDVELDPWQISTVAGVVREPLILGTFQQHSSRSPVGNVMPLYDQGRRSLEIFDSDDESRFP